MRTKIKQLEKSREFWLILCIAVFFFFLRIPSLFEPYWYGDEGIYETIALALTKGQILYLETWDNKPPLLYYTYALVNGDQFLVRVLSLIAGVVSVVVFFLLAKILLKRTVAIVIATALFALLFGLPMFEGNIANAENFMLLPILLASYLCYKRFLNPRHHKSLFIVGLLVGIAFLYKIVAIFDFAAIGLFILISSFPKRLSKATIELFIRHNWKLVAYYMLGFMLPFLLSVVFFGLQGALKEYIQAIFLSTVGYVGYNNTFLIPQGLLITKLLLLGIFISVTFAVRNKVSSAYLFVSLWVSCSLFSSFFSQRPYTHYVLVLIAPLALLFGLIFVSSSRQKFITIILTLTIMVTSLNFFGHWSLSKTTRYYANFISFISDQKSMTEYYSFFDKKAIRDVRLASYLTSNFGDDRSLFVWGNSAQLYYLSNTLPPGRFTVAYHINSKSYIDETAQALKKPPHFIVILDNAPLYPFAMYNYRQVLKIQEANIYERNY